MSLILRETHVIGRSTTEWISGPQAKAALGLYGISLVGSSDAGPEFRFVRLEPRFGQILICTGGEGRVLVEGIMRECTAGHAYVTPPGSTHFYHAVPTVRWCVCWIMYQVDAKDCPMLGQGEPRVIPIEAGTFETAIEWLCKESRGAGDATVMQHWAALISAYARRAVGPLLRLGAVWDAVRADIAHAWSIDELAEIACASAEHLRRLSLIETKTSPMRYVTELRLREAAALLCSRHYSIEEVADRVGYNNPFAFSTAFKRAFGVSPSDFRSANMR